MLEIQYSFNKTVLSRVETPCQPLSVQEVGKFSYIFKVIEMICEAIWACILLRQVDIDRLLD